MKIVRHSTTLFIERTRRDESGYSLTEVVVAIMLLSIAIIPMVGMFDMALRTVSTSGSYDRARSLANLKLEEAKSLPYDSAAATDVRNDFPVVGSSTPDDSSGYYDSGYIAPEAGLGTEFAGLEYRVQKQYLAQPSSTTPIQDFKAHNTDADLMKVTVTVKWNGGNTYSASGVVVE